MSRSTRTLFVLAVLAAGALAFGGLAASSDAITACAGSNGFARLVDSASDCRRGEEVVTWATEGPQGPEGPPGPAGPQGPPGPPGTAGGLDSMVWEIDLKAEASNEVRAGTPRRSAAQSYDQRYREIAGWTGQRIDGALLPEGTSVTASTFPTLADGALGCVSIRDRIEDVPLSDSSCVETATCSPTDGSFPDDEKFEVKLDVTIPERVVELFVWTDISVRAECGEQSEAFGGSHMRPYLTLSWSAE